MRDSLCFILKTINLEAERYAAGHQFLASFDEMMSGCLRLDIRMPLTSGIQVQKRLKAINCELAVSLITGHGDVPMAVWTLQSGVFDVIQKPFLEQDLLDRIYQALDIYE